MTFFDNGLSRTIGCGEEPFELLLTDIVMPEIDGIELARRATELDPEIKVMFITGFAAVALNPDNAAPKDAKSSPDLHLRDLVNEVERLLKAADGSLSKAPAAGLSFPANSLALWLTRSLRPLFEGQSFPSGFARHCSDFEAKSSPRP